MSTDPFDLNFDYNDAAYDELIKEADKDNRVGDHEFLVTDVVKDTWPSGDPRLKVRGNLLTANSAKADWTFSPPPPADVMAVEKATWDQGKKRAIANSITMIRQLAEHYSTTPGKIKVGDQFKVKTTKTRVDKETNEGGFIRIIAFLPKDHAVAGQTAGGTASTPSVGF